MKTVLRRSLSKSAAKSIEIADSMNSNYREYISCLSSTQEQMMTRSVVCRTILEIGDIYPIYLMNSCNEM